MPLDFGQHIFQLTSEVRSCANCITAGSTGSLFQTQKGVLSRSEGTTSSSTTAERPRDACSSMTILRECFTLRLNFRLKDYFCANIQKNYIVSAGCWFDFEKKSFMIQHLVAFPQNPCKLHLWLSVFSIPGKWYDTVMFTTVL